MSTNAAEIQQMLSDADPEFRQLAEEHRKCDHRLTELTGKQDITIEDEIEEKLLKKRKLRLKDQMAERIRSYESQHAVA